MQIFIDDGSTSIKLAWKEDGKVKTAISANSFKPEWSLNLFDESVSSNYEIEGEQFSYDPASADAVVTTETRYQYSQVNVVAIHHALHLAGITPQHVDVVVTLPLSEYLTNQYQQNRENIARKKASVMRLVHVQKGENFIIDSVSVLPESIPAGFDVLTELDEDDSLLIVDLGGTTLDVSHVRSQMTGITKTYCDPKIGVSLITDGIKDVLAGKTRISSLHADNIIKHRSDDLWLEKRLVNEDQRRLVLQTIEEKERVLKNRVSEVLSRFSGYTHVMCVGGGAAIVSDVVQQVTNVPTERFYTSKEPQLALVHGMYKMKEGHENE